jgi:hypothetical protein
MELTNADAANSDAAGDGISVAADATAGYGSDQRQNCNAISGAAGDGGTLAADATAGDGSDQNRHRKTITDAVADGGLHHRRWRCGRRK